MSWHPSFYCIEAFLTYWVLKGYGDNMTTCTKGGKLLYPFLSVYQVVRIASFIQVSRKLIDWSPDKTAIRGVGCSRQISSWPAHVRDNLFLRDFEVWLRDICSWRLTYLLTHTICGIRLSWSEFCREVHLVTNLSSEVKSSRSYFSVKSFHQLI